MAELLFGCDQEIAKWVADRIPHVRSFGACTALGVMSQNRLIAGTVYHTYDPVSASLQISMASESPMWARKEIVASLLRYPFRQLKCWMVFMFIPAELEAVSRSAVHNGFRVKTIFPHMFGKKRHGRVLQMTEPEFSRLYEAHHG